MHHPPGDTRHGSSRLAFESLEDRALLAPFTVGGDPSVNPADFRITTFVSGLNYPGGMLTLSDGSLLVGVSNPVGGTSYFNSIGELLRFTDTNGDGVADNQCRRGYVQRPARRCDGAEPGWGVHPGDEQPGRERADLRAPAAAARPPR